MWIFVVTCNVAIAVACWRVVFLILQFRLAVANFRQNIVKAELNCRSGLALAPEPLWMVQERSMKFRQWQQQGKSRWLLLQQGVRILIWGQRLIRVKAQLGPTQRMRSN
ncbi:MAG: hypothetical protein RLZZ435_2941 [Cyanobacteriota bacterium]|jgi:hypothetical protein